MIAPDWAWPFIAIVAALFCWRMIVAIRSDRKRIRAGNCTVVTLGGMHCAGKRHHDGPHTFTNEEWRRTRGATSIHKQQPEEAK